MAGTVKTRVTVVGQSQHDEGPFDFGTWEAGSLNRVITSLLAIRESIPEEYREIATCEIQSESYYDSHYATIEVEYDRPATPEEIAANASAEETRLCQQEAEQRALYEHLRRKYG